jgi:hypothetical protein
MGAVVELNLSSVLSVSAWVTVIWFTVKHAEKIATFLHKKAKKKTTEAVICYLKRPSQAGSAFIATRAAMPAVGGGWWSAFIRLKRFAALYVAVGMITVFSFGLLSGLAGTDGSSWLFVRDQLSLLPGAFFISWLVAWLVNRALSQDSLYSFLLSLGLGAVLTILYAACWPLYQLMAPRGLFASMEKAIISLTFLDPQMETASWRLLDCYGNVAPHVLAPGEFGFPSQFHLVAFYSGFIVFISIYAEALFAASTAVWLMVYGRFETCRVWLARHFAIKDDPYLYAIIPPILALEFCGLGIAALVAAFPKAG